MLSVLLLCAIELTGVTGSDLRARAFFDANNVKVGDPLVLTVDFLGEAEFRDLHPPALSKSVDRRDWKLDDASAKTDTFRDARRLTYRIRPMREGLVWFPALEFSYSDTAGKSRVVRSNAIPVHARGGAQVVVAGMEEDSEKLPSPPELVADIRFGRARDAAVTDDELFAWNKVLASPSADAFAAFDFPAARLNEAACSVREGNWARALGICRRLEWRIGQTPEVERTIVSALALRFDNPLVELPVWRQVLRPLLKLDWAGRAVVVVGGLAALVLVFWLIGRVIRAVACLALVALPFSGALGETIETVTTNADGSVVHQKIVRGGKGGVSFQMTTSTSSGGVALPHGFGSSPFGGDPFGGDPFGMFDDFDPFGRGRQRGQRQKVEVGIGLAADKESVSVGEDFNLVLSIELPRFVSLAENVRLSLGENDRVQQTGNGYALRPEQGRNPTNVINRLVFPMRAVVPFKGPLHYSVEGEYAASRGGFSLFRTAHPFASGPRTAPFDVEPLPEAGRPADFAGIVSEGLALVELPDLVKVGTNDVVTITYKMRPKGYVPPGWQPPDVAFEWSRQNDAGGRLSEIEYRRFFVADGSPSTPKLSVSYYDPRTKAYKTVTAGGTGLVYVPDAN